MKHKNQFTRNIIERGLEKKKNQHTKAKQLIDVIKYNTN